MWGIVAGSAAIIISIVFSLAKAASKGEEIMKNHRKELMARKKEESSNSRLIQANQKSEEKNKEYNDNKLPPS